MPKRSFNISSSARDGDGSANNVDGHGNTISGGLHVDPNTSTTHAHCSSTSGTRPSTLNSTVRDGGGSAINVEFDSEGRRATPMERNSRYLETERRPKWLYREENGRAHIELEQRQTPRLEPDPTLENLVARYDFHRLQIGCPELAAWGRLAHGHEYLAAAVFAVALLPPGIRWDGLCALLRRNSKESDRHSERPTQEALGASEVLCILEGGELVDATPSAGKHVRPLSWAGEERRRGWSRWVCRRRQGYICDGLRLVSAKQPLRRGRGPLKGDMVKRADFFPDGPDPEFLAWELHAPFNLIDRPDAPLHARLPPAWPTDYRDVDDGFESTYCDLPRRL